MPPSADMQEQNKEKIRDDLEADGQRPSKRPRSEAAIDSEQSLGRLAMEPVGSQVLPEEHTEMGHQHCHSSSAIQTEVQRQVDQALGPLRAEIASLSRRIQTLESQNIHAGVQQAMTMFTSSSDSLFHPTISASSGATGVPALASVAAPAASNLHPSTNSVSYGTHVEAPGTGVHSPALSPPPQSATRPPSRNGSKARARNRRVELSRIARSVMYDMMGLTSSSDPLPAWDAEHPKVTESATGKVTWRWDWSRTVLGSSHNRSFVDAIQETIERERQNPSSVQLLVAIQSVPQEDWGHLRQAIESAYGNLRREYESRWDEGKRAKKLNHKRKNRHRGLKEEKQKRRKTAWTALQSHSDIDATLSSLGVPDASFVDVALDLKYMSSEESDVETPDISTSTNNTSRTVSNRKTFVVHPPVWRHAWIGDLFARLDGQKIAASGHHERGGARPADRVLGSMKLESKPPPDTPEALLDPDWRAAHPGPLCNASRKRQSVSLGSDAGDSGSPLMATHQTTEVAISLQPDQSIETQAVEASSWSM